MILLLVFCKYFTFISIRKEAINKIQIDSRSKMMLYQLTKFSFLGNWSHANKVARPLLMVISKKVASPLLMEFSFWNAARPVLMLISKKSNQTSEKVTEKAARPFEKVFKKMASPISKGSQKAARPLLKEKIKHWPEVGFAFYKGIFDYMGCSYTLQYNNTATLSFIGSGGDSITTPNLNILLILSCLRLQKC